MAKWSKDTVYHQVLCRASWLLSLCIVIRRRRLIYFLCFNPSDIYLADLGEESLWPLSELHYGHNLVLFCFVFILNRSTNFNNYRGFQNNWHLRMLWYFLMFLMWHGRLIIVLCQNVVFHWLYRKLLLNFELIWNTCFKFCFILNKAATFCLGSVEVLLSKCICVYACVYLHAFVKPSRGYFGKLDIFSLYHLCHVDAIYSTILGNVRWQVWRCLE